MAAPEPPIDIFASMRGRTPGRGKSRMTIEFTAPELYWQGDANAVAAETAEVITATIRDNLQAGRDPSGRPLPSPAPATVERRAARLQQAGRGGQAAARITDPKKRAEVQRNYERRYRASKLGQFAPAASSWFGVESGMLAVSVKAVAQNGKWVVYFAGPRGLFESATGSSAVKRVFERIGMWTPAAMRQASVQKALRKMHDAMLGHRVSRLLGALRQLKREAEGLVEAAQEANE